MSGKKTPANSEKEPLPRRTNSQPAKKQTVVPPSEYGISHAECHVFCAPTVWPTQKQVVPASVTPSMGNPEKRLPDGLFHHFLPTVFPD
jgi:hypothetical protein